MAGPYSTEFRLLGSFEVREHGRLLDVGRGKQQALLALLLLNACEVVTTDRVTEALWGEHPPPSALNSIRVFVSHLRKAIGSERLLTRGRGYLLAVEPEELDVARFESLLTEGRQALAAGKPARAQEALRAALAIWRGPPLLDFADEQFAHSEIARLEELRLAAVEDRIEADLALGRDSELVPELQALVSANPLRERLRAQLMLALYRSGRQAEALEVYRQARRTLLDELGLEPGRRLQELERAILRQDARLAPRSSRRTAVNAFRRRRRVMIAIGAGLVVVASVALWLIESTGGSPKPRSALANGVALIDATKNRVAADLPVGAGSTGIAVDGDDVWVTNAQDNSVVRLDAGTKRLVTRISVGSAPGGIASGYGAVWVANLLAGTVSRIDPKTNAVVQTARRIVTPTAVAAGFGSIWVTSADERTLTRIDAVSGHVLGTIPTGAVGRGIAVGAGSVWLTDESSNTVVRVDPRTDSVMKMVSVGNGPTGIAFGSGSVWVANSLGGTVSRLNPATDEVTATIEVGEGPTDVDADSDAVWVAAERARSIVQIDASTNRVVRTIELVNRPKTLAAAGDKVWLVVQPSGAGHRGGRLVVANPALITSIDPGIGGNAALDLTSDGLVAPAHRDGVAGTQLVPDLAAAPPLVTAGRTAYAFQLRRGIRYSSGAVVKASDFRRALERVFGLRSFASTLFRSLRGANACLRMPKRCDLSQGVRTNDATGAIVFRLARPDGEFLSSLETLAPAPPGTPDGEVGVRTVPSTGPYMIERYVPRRVVTLVRNPYFRVWSEVARPDGFADEIQFRLRLRGEDAVNAVESGRADFSFGVPASMLEEVETRYRSQLHLNPAPGTMFFVFLNTRLAPFDDVRVRRAVNYAVDRAAVARALGGTNAAQPLCQIRPPSVAGYRPYCPYTVDPTPGGQWKAPDLARARRLVAASGTKGMKVTLWAWAENIQPAAREVVSALNRLGYRATLRRVDTIDHYFPEVLDEKTRAQAGMFGWIGASGQLPSYVLPSSLTCASIRAPNNNPSFFCDRKIDEQIRHALSVQATEPTGAVALWARIERDIVDLAPWVPLFTPKRAQFVSARVGNYQYNPATGAGVLLDQLWVR